MCVPSSQSLEQTKSVHSVTEVQALWRGLECGPCLGFPLFRSGAKNLVLVYIYLYIIY